MEESSGLKRDITIDILSPQVSPGESERVIWDGGMFALTTLVLVLQKKRRNHCYEQDFYLPAMSRGTETPHH